MWRGITHGIQLKQIFWLNIESNNTQQPVIGLRWRRDPNQLLIRVPTDYSCKNCTVYAVIKRHTCATDGNKTMTSVGWSLRCNAHWATCCSIPGVCKHFKTRSTLWAVLLTIHGVQSVDGLMWFKCINYLIMAKSNDHFDHWSLMF